MTPTTGDPPHAERRSKLSRVFDWALYAGIAGLFLLLVMRGGQGPKEGTRAEGFQLPLAGGEGTLSLAQYRGRPVLLEVFASWCGACERAAPMMCDLQREHAGTGVAFVGVSVDEDPAAARAVKERWPISYPVALDDGSVRRAYGVSLLPTFVLIDREGTIRRVSSGVPSRRTLSRWLTEL